MSIFSEKNMLQCRPQGKESSKCKANFHVMNWQKGQKYFKIFKIEKPFLIGPGREEDKETVLSIF